MAQTEEEVAQTEEEVAPVEEEAAPAEEEAALQEPGVSADEIVLGQSCALEGLEQSLGIGMRAGLLAYFATVNEKGGIQGRKIRLISLDDGYEPDKAINNTKKLIEEDRVFALIGETGTPTSKAVMPIIEEAQVPFIGPFTGADFLRNPYKKYVVNLRCSYLQEMECLAQYLVDDNKFTKVACFHQNDGYGQEGLNGITQALERRELELVATGTFEPNSAAVKSGLLAISKAEPEAVIMVGPYKPCAEIIKTAKKLGMAETVFCNISFVGTQALLNELGSEGQDCIISQVVIYPFDDSILLVKEYQAAMKKHQPDQEIGFVSLEGYMAGRLFCLAVRNVTGELTRESLILSIQQTGSFDLGGITLQYGTEDNQGMDRIFLTMIKNGQIQPLEWSNKPLADAE
jgi:ABC-type branched-subunit amino acid transport system substrate-binding protein